MRFDPFRELDRIVEQNISGGGRTPSSMPMTALRRGDMFLVDLDLPGVDRDEVEITVERNVVTIRARRSPARDDGDEVIIDERSYGEYSRQLFLGDNLDPSGLAADLRDGVLRLTIPVSAASKPRQIPLGSSNESEDTTESRPAEVSSSAG